MNYETYSYRGALLTDLATFFQDRKCGYIDEDYAEDLRDKAFLCDSVTGNASGSYTFSEVKAQHLLAGNWKLILEVAHTYAIEPTISDEYKHSAEWWDVTIRCYLLDEVFPFAVERWNNQHPAAVEDESEEA